MELSRDEHPCAVQIFGNEPKTMAIATEKALEFSPQFIDINIKCLFQ